MYRMMYLKTRLFHNCCGARFLFRRMFSMDERFMIVGLGNDDMPNTRHSVGMMVMNRLVRLIGLDFKPCRECQGKIAVKNDNSLYIVLLKSKLPMNLNGKSVSKAAVKHGIKSSNVYVVHDDLNREWGKISVKEGGSAGGHNGVKSLISGLGTTEFPRIRIGIDRPSGQRNDIVDYVLEKFSAEEIMKMDKVLDESIMKLAQHIGQRTGLKPAHIFQRSTKEE